MSPLQFIPAAAAVFTPVVDRLVDRASHGLSFKSLLAGTAAKGSLGSDHTADPANIADSFNQLSSHDGEHLRRLAESELADFTDAIRAQLSNAGIDTSIPFDLKANESGEIVVDGNHPQRADIEALFLADPSLTAGFRRMVAAMTAHARQQNREEVRDSEFRVEVISGSVTNIRLRMSRSRWLRHLAADRRLGSCRH